MAKNRQQQNGGATSNIDFSNISKAFAALTAQGATRFAGEPLGLPSSLFSQGEEVEVEMSLSQLQNPGEGVVIELGKGKLGLLPFPVSTDKGDFELTLSPSQVDILAKEFEANPNGLAEFTCTVEASRSGALRLQATRSVF